MRIFDGDWMKLPAIRIHMAETLICWTVFETFADVANLRVS